MVYPSEAGQWAGGLVHVNCETHVARSHSQGIVARPHVDSVCRSLLGDSVTSACDPAVHGPHCHLHAVLLWR